MPAHSRAHVLKVYEALLTSEAWKAVLFVSPKLVIRGTRRFYSNGAKPKPDKNRIEVLISVGPPNYREREFISACKRAGESFPVKKVQLAFKKPRRTIKPAGGRSSITAKQARDAARPS